MSPVCELIIKSAKEYSDLNFKMFEDHLHNALKMIFGNIKVKFIPTTKYLGPIDIVMILTKDNNEVGITVLYNESPEVDPLVVRDPVRFFGGTILAEISKIYIILKDKPARKEIMKVAASKFGRYFIGMLIGSSAILGGFFLGLGGTRFTVKRFALGSLTLSLLLTWYILSNMDFKVSSIVRKLGCSENLVDSAAFISKYKESYKINKRYYDEISKQNG